MRRIQTAYLRLHDTEMNDDKWLNARDEYFSRCFFQ
jgi:hypothetical protein